MRAVFLLSTLLLLAAAGCGVTAEVKSHVRTTSEWNALTKTLAKRPALERNMLVLYTMSDWGWCESCRSLENVTRFTRSIAKHKAVAQSKAGTLLVATVDCSATMHFLVDSPCGEISEYPTLSLITRVDDRKEDRIQYSGMSDVFGVLRFLSKNLPDLVTKGFITTTAPVEFRQPPEERFPVTSVKPLLRREEEREVRREMIAATSMRVTVSFVYSIACRNCNHMLSVVEDAARQFDNSEVPNIRFVRSVSDSNIRSRWLPQGYDVPLILIFYTPGTGKAENPLIWEGDVSGSGDLVFYLQRLMQTKIATPLQLSAGQGGPLASNLPATTTEKLVVIRTVKDLGAEFQTGRAENPHATRLLMVSAQWTAPLSSALREVTAFIQAAHTFHEDSPSAEEKKRASFLLVDGTNTRVLSQMMAETKLGQLECLSPPCLFYSAPGPSDEFLPFPHFVTEEAILSFVLDRADDASKLKTLPGKLTKLGRTVRSTSTVVPVKTLRPLLTIGSEDPWDMTAVRGKKFVFLMVVHPVTTLAQGNTSQVNLNRLAYETYESSCKEINQLPNASASTPNATDPSEILCGFVDSSRSTGVTEYLIGDMNPDHTAILRSNPFMAHITSNNPGDIDILFTQPSSELFYNRDRLADSIVGAGQMHPRLDSVVLELNGNSFETVVNDVTKGVMVLFYHKHCEHSKALIPTYDLAAKSFKKDNRDVVMTRIDVVEEMDESLKQEFGVTFYPELRWFPKNNFKKGQGEVFPSTPFKDSIVEYINGEMGYPSLEFEQLGEGENATLTSITKMNWKEIMVDNNYKSHTVLFLYESKEREAHKLQMLKQVEELFMNTEEFGQPKDSHQRLRNENIFNFFRIDALKFRKLLKNNGFEHIFKSHNLPLLAFLPKGTHKLTKIQVYKPIAKVTEALWSEVALSKWLLQRVLPARYGTTDEEGTLAAAQSLRFSTEMQQRNEDAESAMGLVGDIESVLALRNISGLFKGDLVIMYYASWCDHCKTSMPIYLSVAKHFEGDRMITFFRCDVPQHAEVGHQQGIQQFPTYRAYFDGSDRRMEMKGDTYHGKGLHDDNDNGKEFTEWLSTTRGTSKVGDLDREYKRAQENVLELNETNIDLIVEKGDTHVLVEFHAPWCGHCHEMVRVLDELDRFYKSHPTKGHPITIAQMDGFEYGTIAEKYGVKENFPTIFFFVRNFETGSYKQVQYKSHFFSDMIQKFMEENVIQLQTARLAAGLREGEMSSQANKKGGDKKGKKKAEKKGKKNKPAPRFNKGKSKKEQEVAKEQKQREKRKKKLDNQKPPKPKAHGFITQDKSSTIDVKMYNEKMLRRELNKTTIVLALRYKYPQNQRMNMIYSSMTGMLGKLIRSGRLIVAAIPQHEMSDYSDADLPHITMYRGVAQPQVVEFQKIPLPPVKRADSSDDQISDERVNDEQADDDSAFIARVESVANTLEDPTTGGCIYNLTHLGDFVERYFTSAAKFAREANSQNFNTIIHNANVTSVFFFYSNTQEARKISEHFDAVGQSLSHREDMGFWNLDASKNSDLYKKFGSRKLPVILAFDRHTLVDANGNTPLQKTHYRLLSHGKALPKRQDLYDFSLNRPLKAESRCDVMTLELGADAEAGTDHSQLFHPLSASSVPDLQYMMEKHDKTLNGMLVLFTVDWCVYCGAYRAAMMQAVAKLQQHVVVTVVEMDSQTEMSHVKKQYPEVKSFPTMLLFSRQSRAEYKGPKENVAELVDFVKTHVPKASPEDEDSHNTITYRKATITDLKQVGSNTEALQRERKGQAEKPAQVEEISAKLTTGAQVTLVKGFWCGDLCNDVDQSAVALDSMLQGGNPVDVNVLNVAKPGAMMKRLKSVFKVMSLPSYLIRCSGVAAPSNHVPRDKDDHKPVHEEVDGVKSVTVRCTPSNPLCSTPQAVAKLVQDTCFEYYVPPVIQTHNVTETDDTPEVQEKQGGDDDDDDDDLDDDVVDTEEKPKEETKEAVPTPEEEEDEF